MAAKAMGLATVPVIELDGLSEAQVRALRLADNKIALNAGWDLEILQAELADLFTIDIGIDPVLTGFSTGEIDVILKGSDDPDDDVIPAVPVTPARDPATSGSVVRTGSAAATAEMRPSCLASSARASRSTRPSSIRPIMSGSAATPMPRGGTASSPWPRAR
jgi:ParB-like chromosome segregation protein Spo0J